MTRQSLHNMMIFMRKTKSHAIMHLARYKFMEDLDSKKDSFKLYLQKNKNEFESMVVLVREAIRAEALFLRMKPLVQDDVPDAVDIMDWNLLRMPEHYYGEVSLSF